MDTLQRTRWVALLAVTTVALYLSWRILQPFADVLILAGTIAMVGFPAHRRIRSRIRQPSLSALVSTLLAVLVVLAPLTLIAIAVAREIPQVFSSLREALTQLETQLTALAGSHPWLAAIREKLGDGPLLSLENIEQLTSRAGGTLVRGTWSVVGGILGVILETAFLIFTLYYLFRDGDRFAEKLPRLLPLDERQSRPLIRRTRDVVIACVYGVMTVAAIQGFIGGVAFLILGLPSPVTWGVVMMLLSTIPMAGAWIVWVPAAGWLALNGHYGKAITLALIGGIVIGLIDNLLRPKLVGNRARMHELAIFFAILGGLQYFGILGLLIGPVIVALTFGLVEIVRHTAIREDDDANANHAS